MAKNTVTITIIHATDSGWESRKLDGCFWDDDLAARITKTGISSSDSLYASIPWQDTEVVVTKTKDYVIKGELPEGYNISTYSTIGTLIKALKASHDVFTITSFSTKDHGSRRMWHYELSGK